MTTCQSEIRPTDTPHAYPVCTTCYEAGYANSDVTEEPRLQLKDAECFTCGEPTDAGLFLSDRPEHCGICSYFISHCVCAAQNLR